MSKRLGDGRQPRTVFVAQADAIIRARFDAGDTWEDIHRALRVAGFDYTRSSVSNHGMFLLGLRRGKRGKARVSLRTVPTWTPAETERLRALWPVTLTHGDIADALNDEFPAADVFTPRNVYEKGRSIGLSRVRERQDNAVASVAGDVFRPTTTDDWYWGAKAYDLWSPGNLTFAEAEAICRPAKVSSRGPQSWGFYLKLDGSERPVSAWWALVKGDISVVDLQERAKRYFFPCAGYGTRRAA